ncbi:MULTISPECIES: hypothetical protein [Bacillus]|uniref:hypothetical protein n=1 Tax=Bacillus TaxID=1386 RepID=UPI000BB7B1F8|nr:MULTISPECIES: hypothetical protein [Bacillus]
MVKNIWNGALTGLVSGILMGLLMKLFQTFFQKDVYTLLLNIDFIPYLGSFSFSETVEFIFHLIIALGIGVLFSLIVQKYHLVKKRAQFLLSIILTFPTIFLYFPLTFLAMKETPAMNDVFALTLWTVAHLFFALLLPIFYRI